MHAYLNYIQILQGEHDESITKQWELNKNDEMNIKLKVPILPPKPSGWCWVSDIHDNLHGITASI